MGSSGQSAQQWAEQVTVQIVGIQNDKEFSAKEAPHLHRKQNREQITRLQEMKALYA